MGMVYILPHILKGRIMAKIGKMTGENGLNIYPGTIPQAVIDPTTKKNLRKELDDFYVESVVMEDDSEEGDVVESVAADTATKALQDWDGNDIRASYIKKSSIAIVTESEYKALGESVNSDGVIYFITK